MYKAVVWVALAAMVGCSPGRVDLSGSGRVRAADVGSAMVDVTPPQVVVEGNDLVVSGTVARRPGFDGPVPGRLFVSVVAADGQTELQAFTTGWDPPHVPVTGDRRATYRVRYGWLPPDGATVRVGHEPNPNGPDNPTGDAATYRPGFRSSDRRSQLTGGLGGVNSRVTPQRNYNPQQR